MRIAGTIIRPRFGRGKKHNPARGRLPAASPSASRVAMVRIVRAVKAGSVALAPIGRRSARPPAPARARRPDGEANPFVALTKCWVAFVAGAWHVARDLADVCKPCRFSVAVVAGGGLALLVSEQGRETAVRLLDNSNGVVAWVWFYLAIQVWALTSWLWARTLLNRAFGLERPDVHTRVGWLVNHVPRAIGLAAYVIAAASLFAVPVPPEGELNRIAHVVLTALFGVAFYWWAIRRHDLALRLHVVERLRRLRHAEAAAPDCDSHRAEREQIDNPHLRDCLPFKPLWFWLIHGGLAFLAVAALHEPVMVGQFFGSPAVVFLAFGSIVPVGSWLVYLGQRDNYPVVTTLVIMAFVFSFMNDNHEVRTLRIGGTELPQRSVDAVARAWAANCLPAKGPGGPVIFVATAGGGLRAAYWTASVLGRLQDEQPDFHRRLFGISGVSGGSLGAATYMALLREDNVDCGGESVNADYGARGRAALHADFLAPTFTAMLYGDLMQRFLPVALFDDRGAALERAFESAWPQRPAQHAALGCGATGLQMPFHCLWRGADGRTVVQRPSLLLNGTHQETGKRVLTSNIAIQPPDFLDTYDFRNLVGREIRLSTAVLNSARFPYVTPGGTLVREDNNYGHIVDGGYFENFGAATLAEAIRAVTAVLADREITPIVIQISSDPQLDGTDVAACGPVGGRPDQVRGRAGGNDLLAPIDAAFAARSARGVLAAANLARDYCGAGGAKFFHFRMCGWDEAHVPPLGWVMSKASERLIGEDMLEQCGNAAQFDELKRLLQSAKASAAAQAN